jgi:hypothetical protein
MRGRDFTVDNKPRLVVSFILRPLNPGSNHYLPIRYKDVWEGGCYVKENI